MLHRFEYKGKILFSRDLEKDLNLKELVVFETGTGNSSTRDAYFVEDIALCIPTDNNTKPYRLVLLDK